jgi:PAS domain S-box-containing protein
MSPQDSGTLVATLGIQLQLAGSLLCVALGVVLQRGMRDRPWLGWWAVSFGAVALAVAALLARYLLVEIAPFEELSPGHADLVAGLYAAYGGGKLAYLCSLLAGTWLFRFRKPMPPVGVGAAAALILGVGVLFALAPTELNSMVAWQAGFSIPVYLACGLLLSTLEPERRTRGSRMLALVFFLLAGLWTVYVPAFLSSGPGPTSAPGQFLGWLTGHNSYIDTLFEFLLGFGMLLAVLDDVFLEAESSRAARLRDIAASESRLAQIIRAASDGIVLLDRDHRIAHCNPAALEILRTTQDELLGQPFDRFVRGSGGDVLRDSVAGPPGRPGPGMAGPALEIQGRRADGEAFPMEVSLRAIGEPEVEGYVLVIRDLTERVRLEDEQSRMQAQLAQTARMETIGRMVSGVAHELNNPLTAILAFSQDLLQQEQSPADAEALTTIVQQAQRCRAIVQDLLTFARTKREDRQSIGIAEIVRRVLPAFERQAAAHAVTLEVAVRDSLPPVHANPAALEQVLANLLSNALQAIGTGGAIAVRAEVRGDRLALLVEDDGPGIPADVLPRLFEPFFTTKDPGEGTGLGLSVSHGILEQHGGMLVAENRSEAGRHGARFTLLLPYLDRRAVRREGGEPRRSEAYTGVGPAPRTVLIVDDEAAIRTAIRRYLERLGWTVEQAGNGREAVEILGLHDDALPRLDRFDAIVTDLRMPGVSGIEIHDRIAAAKPAALSKLVLISGDIASSEVAEFLTRLRQPLVQKPFDMRALADLLDRVAPPTPAPAAAPASSPAAAPPG